MMRVLTMSFGSVYRARSSRGAICAQNAGVTHNRCGPDRNMMYKEYPSKLSHFAISASGKGGSYDNTDLGLMEHLHTRASHFGTVRTKTKLRVSSMMLYLDRLEVDTPHCVARSVIHYRSGPPALDEPPHKQSLRNPYQRIIPAIQSHSNYQSKKETTTAQGQRNARKTCEVLSNTTSACV